MKPLKFFLLLIPIVLGSASQRSSETLGNRTVRSNKEYGHQVLLEYIGHVTVAWDLDMAINVSIDSSIGVRYEVTFTRVTYPADKRLVTLIAHVAIFYKFSNPYQSVQYNFLTHKSTVNKGGGSPDSDPDVEVIGKETVNTYLCSHLQHGKAPDEVSDYWMSPSVPGFSKLGNALKTINSGLPSMAFSGTIFNWGGLVKWTSYRIDESTGAAIKLDLHLQKANTDVTLPSKTFDVPSK